MPQRPRTPSPGPDEPKYLTVVRPYPLNANMELDGDLKQTVYWIASCIGSDPLLAVFYKPSSPNMIIIEVLRSFDRWESLLGEHKWAEFLRSPSEEERGNVSQIFYCTLGTGRHVQKHGWRRKDVESDWFRSWTRNNRIVKQPYPTTSYCPTPPEDKTNAPLCRPLPVRSFPPPAPPRAPPVGSPEWLKLKEQGKTPSLKGAWAKGAPTRQDSAPGSTVAGPARGVPVLASGSVRPKASVRSSSASASLPPGIDSPAPLTITSSNEYTSPPESTVSPSSVDGDWPSVPPPLTRGSSVASGSSSSSGSGQLTPAPVTDGSGDHVIGTIASEQFAQAMASLSLDDELWAAGNQQDGPAAIAPDQTGWAGYVFKTEEDDKPKEPEIECKTHGKLCKKGICKQYKAQKRERERAKEAAQRNAEKEKRIAEKAKKDQNPSAPKTKYNMLPARHDPSSIVLPSSIITGAGWGKLPAGAANTSSSGAATAGSSAGSAAPRPAKGRRMNAANAAAAAAAPVLPNPTARSSDDESKTDGWGDVSQGPWPEVASAADTADISYTKPPSSVASSNGWGKVSNGPWGPPAGGFGRGRKAPSSVASSGWGHVSDGPWGGIKKKGPSSVSSSASGWGSVSQGPWGSRAPSVHGYSDEDDDARTVDGRDDEEEGAKHGRSISGGSGDAANKSWADLVDEEDRKSVASSTGGWGKISNGPW